MVDSGGFQLVQAYTGRAGRVLERDRFVLMRVRKRNSLRANEQHKQNCANGSTEFLRRPDHDPAIMTPKIAISAAIAQPR